MRGGEMRGWAWGLALALGSVLSKSGELSAYLSWTGGLVICTSGVPVASEHACVVAHMRRRGNRIGHLR